MTDARENDEAALKEQAGHTTGNLQIKYGRQIWAGGRAIMHFWAVDIGDAVAAANARRALACWDRMKLLTTAGIERHTPEQIEAALINADAARLRIESLEAENEKLKRFKDYVHKRLDDAGVPKDPESSHKAEGCRIGGRLDLVLVPVSTTNAQQL